MALHRIATLLLEPVALFEYGIANEVFGLDRTDDGVPEFEFLTCAYEPSRPLRITGGGQVLATSGFAAAEAADLLIIPAGGRSVDTPAGQAALDTLRRAAANGTIILSVCSGAFVLAASGLLDGKVAGTHWKYAAEMAELYPAVTVDADVLFVDEGQFITSAGTAAGIDACLHLVRRECGAEAANQIARRMVVPPHRDGGQRQFVQAPVPAQSGDGFGELLDYLQGHLDREFTVAELARRQNMSARTFARRFSAEVGTTPHRWILRQRVERARGLLETTSAPIETVAASVGFGSAALLRHHFQAATGVTPQTYRKRFSATECRPVAVD